MGKAMKRAEQSWSFSPENRRRPIDLVCLAKQTLGDPGLENEVLIVFDQMAHGYVSKLMASQDRADTTQNLHSLKGASLGIGAQVIAAHARSAETELKQTGRLSEETLADIAMAVEEASVFIAGLLRD